MRESIAGFYVSDVDVCVVAGVTFEVRQFFLHMVCLLPAPRGGGCV